MDWMRNLVIFVAASLLCVPLAYGQDLSRYRNFSLGASLTEVSRQVNAKPADVHVIHQSPALIQELTWWPVQSYPLSARPESVQDIRFSFYDGNLYRVVITYQPFSTEGLTAEDIVDAISTKYGAGTLIPATTPSTTLAYTSTQQSIASWEDAQYSLTLSHSPISGDFQLVMYSKQLDGQADAAITEAVKQEREGAPQREIARAKKEAEALEATRLANLKAFRP